MGLVYVMSHKKINHTLINKWICNLYQSGKLKIWSLKVMDVWKSSESMFRVFTTCRREKIVGEPNFRSFFEVCRWSMGLVPSLKLTYPLKMDPGKGDAYWKPPILGAMLVWGSVYIYDPARETAPHKQELTPQQWHCPPKSVHFAILRTQRNVD